MQNFETIIIFAVDAGLEGTLATTSRDIKLAKFIQLFCDLTKGPANPTSSNKSPSESADAIFNLV